VIRTSKIPFGGPLGAPVIDADTTKVEQIGDREFKVEELDRQFKYDDAAAALASEEATHAVLKTLYHLYDSKDVADSGKHPVDFLIELINRNPEDADLAVLADGAKLENEKLELRPLLDATIEIIVSAWVAAKSPAVDETTLQSANIGGIYSREDMKFLKSIPTWGMSESDSN
jgi:hypothetical protein